MKLPMLIEIFSASSSRQKRRERQRRRSVGSFHDRRHALTHVVRRPSASACMPRARVRVDVDEARRDDAAVRRRSRAPPARRSRRDARRSCRRGSRRRRGTTALPVPSTMRRVLQAARSGCAGCAGPSSAASGDATRAMSGRWRMAADCSVPASAGYRSQCTPHDCRSRRASRVDPDDVPRGARPHGHAPRLARAARQPARRFPRAVRRARASSPTACTARRAGRPACRSPTCCRSRCSDRCRASSSIAGRSSRRWCASDLDPRRRSCCCCSSPSSVWQIYLVLAALSCVVELLRAGAVGDDPHHVPPHGLMSANALMQMALHGQPRRRAGRRPARWSPGFGPTVCYAVDVVELRRVSRRSSARSRSSRGSPAPPRAEESTNSKVHAILARHGRGHALHRPPRARSRSW